jgi:hypothetical protein
MQLQQKTINRSLECVWILSGKTLSCVWVLSERQAAPPVARPDQESIADPRRKVA